MECRRCGHDAQSDHRFCASCGAQLDLPEPAAGEPPVASGAEPAVEPVPTVPVAAATAPPRVRYAGFWRRAGGALVDAILLFFPEAILRVMLGLPVLAYEDRWGEPNVLLAEGTAIVLSLLYCSLLECSAAQGSLGQQLFGTRVTDLHGRRIGFGRAVGRQIGKIVSVLLCCFGYGLQLWNVRRQTLHDMMAGCVVVVATGDSQDTSGSAGMVESHAGSTTGRIS